MWDVGIDPECDGMRRTVSRKKIEQFSNRIAEQFRPEKIVLFGSYARGTPTSDSDIDLLVVMPFRGRGARMATTILQATEPDFPVELVVRKPQQVERRLQQNDFFLREIIDRGIVLYASDHS